MRVLKLFAQVEHRREKRREGAVVGVTAGVGFDRDVLGERDVGREARFALREERPAHERRHDLRRSRGHEEARCLGSRELREEVVLALDGARRDETERPVHA